MRKFFEQINDDDVSLMSLCHLLQNFKCDIADFTVNKRFIV